MEKKRLVGIVSTLLCLAMGLLRWLDLVNFTDYATGFPKGGAAMLRYLVLAAALAALWICSRFASCRPGDFAGRCLPMGAAALGAGTALAFIGGISIADMLSGSLNVFNFVRAVVVILSGVWFFVAGISAFSPLGETPTLGAGVGVLGTLAFFWLAVERFAVEPAALERVTHTMQVLDAVMALLFVSCLVKVFYLQGASFGRQIFFTGMGCFLLGSCIEFPQALCATAAGTAAEHELAWGVVMGLVGLVGLAAAWIAVSPESTQPAPEV